MRLVGREGLRPTLAGDMPDQMRELAVRCWENNPMLRPSFTEIVEFIERIIAKNNVCACAVCAAARAWAMAG
jgi:hypothetical protein